MSEKPLYDNPGEASGPAVDAEVMRLQQEDKNRLAGSSTFQQGVLAMISKLIEMNRLLAKSFVTQNRADMDRCALLAKEVHEKEKTLTSYLLSRGVPGEMFEGVIRFPYRLERIGDMLESILHCCRVKVHSNITFSEIADKEVDELLGNWKKARAR